MAKLLIPTDTSQATLGYLLADGTIVGSTSQAQDFGSNGIKADVIAESTSGSGVTLSNAFSLSGDLTPPQITANQNDYNPTNLDTASVLRLDTDASRNITGIVPPSPDDGRILVIHNIGSNNLSLVDDFFLSAAANRFALSGNIVLEPDDAVTLQYDTTTNRWRAIGGSTATVKTLLNSVVHSDTATVTANRGKLIVANSSVNWDGLVIGAARRLLQVNSGGTDPEWASNIDIPGTLDVTGAATLDSTLDVAGSVALGNLASIVAGRIVNVDGTATAQNAVGGRFRVVSDSTSGSSRNTFGLQGSARNSIGGSATGNILAGLDFQVEHNSTRTLSSLLGVRLDIRTLSAGSGAVDVAAGLQLTKSWAGDVPATVDGLDLGDLGDSGETTLRVIRIRSQTLAGTTTIAISQEGASAVGVASTRAHNRLAADTMVGADALPLGVVHIDQTSTTGAKPVLLLDQADVDEDFLSLDGTSVTTSADATLVEEAEVATPGALTGWFKVHVKDNRAGGIAEADYYIQLYAAPAMT